MPSRTGGSELGRDLPVETATDRRAARAARHFRALERMYRAAPATAYFAPEVEVSRGVAVVTIPVREELHHAGGAVHGAAYFKAADDAAFFAVNSLVRDVLVVTANFSLHFARPVVDGFIRAEGRVVQRGRRLFVAEAVLTDKRGREVGRGSGSFIKSETRLGPAIGYA